MSITVTNTMIPMAMLTGGIAVAERVIKSEWSWTWIGYFWGGFLALCVVGWILAGIFALISHMRGGEERKRQARLVSYDGFHIHICDPQKNPPGVGRLVIVPALGLIDVDPLPPSISACVNAAVEQLKRDVAPAAWIEKLPGLLSPLRELGLEVREPASVSHWHDPGPSSRPPPNAT